MQEICIFKRTEKKYLLSAVQGALFKKSTAQHLAADEHHKCTVRSLYLDTPDKRLIRNSMEGLVYKEKLRLRSYTALGENTPDEDSDRIFFELKKKYKGIVYKRRVPMTMAQAEEYLCSKKPPFDSQIMREIDYAMKFYGYPQPSVLISYEREAFAAKDDPSLRITFDSDIRFQPMLHGFAPTGGEERLTASGAVLMEIKTDKAVPLWLSHALDMLRIYPSSYSKYGEAYKRLRTPCKNNRGSRLNRDTSKFSLGLCAASRQRNAVNT